MRLLAAPARPAWPAAAVAGELDPGHRGDRGVIAPAPEPPAGAMTPSADRWLSST
ncbi:hypothetical protein WME91_55390 [Sorangium sp. So ce269]